MMGHTPLHFDFAQYRKEVRESSRRELFSAMDRWVYRDVKSAPRIGEGDPADEIVSAAEEIGADLIVVATHGRSGWRRFVLGSVTEKLMRSAECPILTVRCGDESE